MAQAGYTPIQLYYSTTAAAVPLAANLAAGELAINIVDGKLYYENNSGVVTLLASASGASGDVVGPASATDNAVARFDGTTGKLIQNGVVIIGDTGAVTGVTDLTASGNLTLSGGTANGVTYLNGSKVVTSGSALTFDGSNFFGGTNIYASGRFYAQRSSSSLNLPIAGYTDGSAGAVLSGTKGDIVAFGNAGGDGVIFANSNTEQMRLTSTGLGIGTSSPTTRLSITDSTGPIVRLVRTSNRFELSADTDFMSLNARDASTYITFKTADTERMRLDSSGNLGLGVTPSAYTAGIKAIDIGNGSAILNPGSSAQTWIYNNAYNNSGAKYKNSSLGASWYQMVEGQHAWYTAPSGTAGNAITFTQAMTLDASGNLGIGTTSPATRLEVNGVSEGEYFRAGGGTISARSLQFSSFTVSGLAGVGHQINVPNASGVLTFATGSTERARITSGGALVVGVTSPQIATSIYASGNSATDGVIGARNGTGNSTFQVVMDSNNNCGYLGTSSPSGTALIRLNGEYGIQFTSGGSERARIDSSGNFMVGQTSATGKVSFTGTGSGNTGILAINATDTASTFVWAQQAFLAGQTAGQNFINFIGKEGSPLNAAYVGYKFSSAGSANNLLTFGHYGADNLMNLDGNGNLLVGTTSVGPVNANAITIEPANSRIRVAHGSTANGTPYIQFDYNGSNIGSITQNTTTSVLYNVTSDQRLKENIVDAPEFGSVIDSIQVRSFDWKENNSHQRAGFIAQELVIVAPEAVHQPADPEEMMAVDYSKLVPMLVKEVQSLRKRLADAGL